jgi:hypothetical protein
MLRKYSYLKNPITNQLNINNRTNFRSVLLPSDLRLGLLLSSTSESQSQSQLKSQSNDSQSNDSTITTTPIPSSNNSTTTIPTTTNNNNNYIVDNLRQKIASSSTTPERIRTALMASSPVTQVSYKAYLAPTRPNDITAPRLPALKSAKMSVDVAKLSAVRGLNDEAVDMLRQVVGPRFEPVVWKQTRYRIQGCEGMNENELRDILVQHVGDVREVTIKGDVGNVVFLKDQSVRGIGPLEIPKLLLSSSGSASTLILTPTRPIAGKVHIGNGKSVAVIFQDQHFENSRKLQPQLFDKMRSCVENNLNLSILRHEITSNSSSDGSGGKQNLLVAFSTPDECLVFAERVRKALDDDTTTDTTTSTSNEMMLLGNSSNKQQQQNVQVLLGKERELRVFCVGGEQNIQEIQQQMSKFGEIISCTPDKQTMSTSIVNVTFKDQESTNQARKALVMNNTLSGIQPAYLCRVSIHNNNNKDDYYFTSLLNTVPLQIKPIINPESNNNKIIIDVAWEEKTFLWHFETHEEAKFATKKLRQVLQPLDPAITILGPQTKQVVDVPPNSHGTLTLTKRLRISPLLKAPGMMANSHKELFARAKKELEEQLNKLVDGCKGMKITPISNNISVQVEIEKMMQQHDKKVSKVLLPQPKGGGKKPTEGVAAAVANNVASSNKAKSSATTGAAKKR